ncbi:Sodium/hydrogen exchanger family-domain-containing protein [Amylostereum chailletii]|nr:Sodium/hydrogen exchanger family-domain-containing protein [Amylostereum chailletii]
MVSLLVKEKLYINEVVLGTGFGVLMGPHVANVFDPRSWTSDTNALTLEIMRIVLATGLFAIGVELPQSYMAKTAKSLLVMVVPTMAFGWVISAAFIHLLFPNLGFIAGLAISACLTPTDPIICAAIVGGKFAVKHVPLNLRRLLAAESASNDGLAYPFLSISIYLMTEPSRRTAIEKWFIVGWLYEVLLGIILGGALGYGFSQLMKLTHRKGFIDRESYVAQYLALAIFTIGVTSTLGSDDLLAAFAAGTAISWDGHFNMQVENEVFSSVVDLLLNCACFIYIGAWLPFNQFNSPEIGITPWRLVLFSVPILVLRRIPSMLLLYKWIPEIRSWREALFSGHFGAQSLVRMGVGAIFISTLATVRLENSDTEGEPDKQLLTKCIQPIVAFVVLCSIIVHGCSIPFFSIGRGIGSRTVSLSRTLTARSGDTPDWLLWAHRSGGPSPADVEHGTGKSPEDNMSAHHVSSHYPVLGEAIMLADPTNTMTRRVSCKPAEDHQVRGLRYSMISRTYLKANFGV